jgi:hypothetical protein
MRRSLMHFETIPIAAVMKIAEPLPARKRITNHHHHDPTVKPSGKSRVRRHSIRRKGI